MKRSRRAEKLALALLGASIFLSSCNASSNAASSDGLSIALSPSLLDETQSFLSDFAKDNPKLKLHLTVLEEEEMLYRVRHDKLDCDLLFSSNLELVLGNSTYFADLSSTEFASEYSSYIRDFLTLSDSKLYCLPSPGSLSPIAINVDLLSRYNLSFPTTFSELKEFGSKSSGYAYPMATSYSSSESYLDFFLRSTVPTFFSSTKGNLQFKDFVSGKVGLGRSPYLDEFSSALEGFRDLCNSSIFDFSSSPGPEAFLEGDAFSLSISPGFDFETAYKNAGSEFNYTFVSDLGTAENHGWISANSDFYVSALEKNYKGEQSKISDLLLSYFSSIEGQKHFTLNEDGSEKMAFSYLSEYTLSLDSHYSQIEECFEKGRVYLSDRLGLVANKNYETIRDYAEGKLTTGAFVENVDANFESNSKNTNSVLAIPGFERFGDEVNSSSQHEMAEVLAKNLKSITNDDVFCLQESFIKYPVYNGSIYSNELDSVFDSSLCLVPVELKGAELKKALDLCASFENSRSSRDGLNPFSRLDNVDVSYPFAFSSFGYITEGAYKLNNSYRLNNNALIEDGKLYRASLPSSFVSSGEFELLKSGDAYKALTLYSAFLAAQVGEK